MQLNLSVEAVVVAMTNEYPDAPDDVLMETSAQEIRRKVRNEFTLTVHVLLVPLGGSVIV